MIPFPKKKYNIIYSDPAWYFKTYSDKGEKRSAVQHYNCMSIDDICNLPLRDISADDCILFIWVTYPLLKEGLDTIRSWNFKYKTCAFSWIKKNVRRGERNSIPNGVLYWKGGELDDELTALGIRPRKTISLGEIFGDPYFEAKYILHFDARDIPRVRKPRQDVS